MTNQYPLVSIAVTTYNGGLYLQQQLDSLFNQDYPNLEIVVADDCSSDITRVILKQYEECPPRSNIQFRWYKNERNLGYIKNFEEVIRECKGEFVALSDQDDIWYANKISKTLECLLNQKALLAYCDADLIDSFGGQIKMNLLSHSPIGPISGNDYKKFYLLNSVNGCTALIRRELFVMAAPFPDDMPHDWWLSYVAALEGRLAHCSERLMGYRMHASNTMGITYRVSKINVLQYVRQKLSKYSRRFIRKKLNYPRTKFFDAQKRLRSFKLLESAKGHETYILDNLLAWVNDKVSGDSDLSKYKHFFEQYANILGIRDRPLLYMALKTELLRAKIKLIYALLSPILFVGVLAYLFSWGFVRVI